MRENLVYIVLGALTVVLFAAAFFAVGLLLRVPEANAQTMQCAPAAKLETTLRDKHKEGPVWIGKMTVPNLPADMSEIYLFITSSLDGNWTAYTRASKDGVTYGCIVGTGTDGQAVDIAKTVH